MEDAIEIGSVFDLQISQVGVSGDVDNFYSGYIQKFS